MAGAPSTTADNGDFTVNNGHSSYTLVNAATVQQSTTVRHTHNDGTTTIGATSTPTMPEPQCTMLNN
eukprot:6460133-Amphidinium_carterae.2